MQDLRTRCVGIGRSGHETVRSACILADRSIPAKLRRRSVEALRATRQLERIRDPCLDGEALR